MKSNRKTYCALIALVVINLIISWLALPGVGESMDEQSQRQYGERNVQAVKSLIGTGALPDSFNETPRQGSHGPAFIMVVVVLRDLFLLRGTLVQRLNFSHFLYFTMFQVGMVSLFFLARRWVSETAAFGTALLFNTQPLLVGHAFMNPKDVVFMSLLIASAVLGLRMVDQSEGSFPATGRLFLDNLRFFFGQFLRADVWLAGFLLGFSSAVRVAAPLIGIVILAYILVSRKWQMLLRFAAYGLIAFGFMFMFWPYLWPDPIGRLSASILNSARYPGLHLTLFEGALVNAQSIPLSYLPVLLVAQLTETMLLFALMGAVVLVLKKFRWDLLVLILIWFVLPAMVIIGFRINLYDNFRQVFFILPPLFLLAGVGLDWLLVFIRRPVTYYAVLFLILLPGLYANITLHPYQYIYYNQLVGGVRGAYRVFELDYWHLAFREAQSYVNQTANANAHIFADNTRATAQTFARPDLIFNTFGARKKSRNRYDYMIVSTSENSDKNFAECPTVFFVERQGVPLVYVKVPD